jgi:hypothetical protein
MKFQTGDTTDTALCIALKHEFLRCDDAFQEFASAATAMITQGENRRLAYTAYNAYARFVHHLYEFMLGAIARDCHNTTQLKHDIAERYIASHTQRVLTNRREAILNGTAPSWENPISYFPEKIPPSFAKDFRQCRNIASGHVKVERASLNLTDFYDQYHKFLGMLYRESQNWWGRLDEEFPDLE